MRHHSICRWTFHSGKGGFLPAHVRPSWAADKLDSSGVVAIIANKIRPRLPEHIKLGYELHFDTEVDTISAPKVAEALQRHGVALAMITPGAHSHFAYGGIASLDPDERSRAERLGIGALELAYGPLRDAWHPHEELAPSFVIWNGSWGYDLGSPAIYSMYANLKASIAALCER